MSDIDNAKNDGLTFRHSPVVRWNAANLPATASKSIFTPWRFTSHTAYVPVNSFYASMSSSFSPFRSHHAPIRVHFPDSANFRLKYSSSARPLRTG